MKSSVLSCLVCLAVVMATVSCGGSSSDGDSIAASESEATPETEATTAAADGSTDSPTVGGADDRTQGVSDTEIILGSSVPQTGFLAIAGNISASTNACFDKVNADGGIHGRQIKYIVYDDAYAPDQTATNVRRLVESDDVFAVVGTVGTVHGLGVLEYLDGVGVPYVFAVSGSSTWSDPVKPRVYGFQPTYTFEGGMFANYFANTAADKTVGVIVQNDDSGEEFVQAFEAAAAAVGLDIATIEYYQAGAESYAPQVLNLQNAGVEIIAMQAIYPAVAAILTESDSLGYDPEFYVANIGFTEALFDVVDSAILDGTHFAGYFPQASDDDPGRAEHEALMAEYAPDIRVDDYSMLGWSICDTVVDALDRAGEDLEWGSFLAALDSTTDFSNGLAPPVTLSSSDHQAVENERIYVAQDGTFVAATDLLGADGLPMGS